MRVQLEECNELLSINLEAIGMTSLSLGTCPNLTSLSLAAPVLKTLDLKCACCSLTSPDSGRLELAWSPWFC